MYYFLCISISLRTNSKKKNSRIRRRKTRKRNQGIFKDNFFFNKKNLWRFLKETMRSKNKIINETYKNLAK